MKKHGKLAGLQRRKAISGYLFILPFIIGFAFFMVKPMFNSLYMSFCNVDIGAGYINNIWAGAKNYITAFTVDVDFTRLVTEEITRMFYNSLAIMVFSFFTALILNQEFKGRALVRAIFFLPVILSSGVLIGIENNNALMGAMESVIEESNTGPSITDALKNILVTAGVGTRAFETVFELVDGIYDVALASGIQIIIFLSGLQTISASMYEAADIEGCTAWEKLWKITFPMVSSIFLVNWIYTIVDFCMRTDNPVMTKIDTTMISRIEYGLASAFSWSYFGIVIVIIAISSFFISKGVYYYE